MVEFLPEIFGITKIFLSRQCGGAQTNYANPIMASAHSSRPAQTKYANPITSSPHSSRLTQAFQCREMAYGKEKRDSIAET